jgi:AcrR family transcriptional regulator
MPPEARTARSRRTRAALVAAVRDELRHQGHFTGEAVAQRAGCSPATYYVHLPTKDDALAAAFDLVLDDLDALAERLFDVERLTRRGLEAWSREVVDETVQLFATESLVFRVALSRLREHDGLRRSYRSTEQRVLARIGALLTEAAARDLAGHGQVEARAEAVLVLTQALNNPRLLRRPRPRPVLDQLAAGLRSLVAGPPGEPSTVTG